MSPSYRHESYACDDSEAADRILAECAHKRIRTIVPADFLPAHMRAPKTFKESVKEKKLKDREVLALRCATYLRAHPACTTAQLVRVMDSNVRLIPMACRTIPGVQFETTVIKGSRTMIWRLSNDQVPCSHCGNPVPKCRENYAWPMCLECLSPPPTWKYVYLPNHERLPGGTTAIDTNQPLPSAAPVDRVVGQSNLTEEIQ